MLSLYHVGAMFRLAVATLFTHLLMGLFTGVILALLHLPPTWHFASWLAPLVPNPLLNYIVGIIISICAVVAATITGQAIVKLLIGWAADRGLPVEPPPLPEEVHDVMLWAMPWLLGFVIVTASLWIIPWMDFDPTKALSGFAALLCLTLLWAVAIMVMSVRYMRHRRKNALLNRARPV